MPRSNSAQRARARPGAARRFYCSGAQRSKRQRRAHALCGRCSGAARNLITYSWLQHRLLACDKRGARAARVGAAQQGWLARRESASFSSTPCLSQASNTVHPVVKSSLYITYELMVQKSRSVQSEGSTDRGTWPARPTTGQRPLRNRPKTPPPCSPHRITHKHSHARLRTDLDRPETAAERSVAAAAGAGAASTPTRAGNGQTTPGARSSNTCKMTQ